MKAWWWGLMVCLLSGCASMDRAKLLGPETLAPDAVTAIVIAYNGALSRAQASPHDPMAIHDYAEASIALTDAACLAWLDRVTQAERSLHLGGGGLDVTSALATTILGIASATPATVAGVGAAFTALAGYGRVLDTAVLTAPSSYAAQTKLLEMLDSSADQIRSFPGNSWLQAYSKIARYTRLCSFAAIQAAVNDALANTTTTVRPNGAILTAPRRIQ